MASTVRVVLLAAFLSCCSCYRLGDLDAAETLAAEAAEKSTTPTIEKPTAKDNQVANNYAAQFSDIPKMLHDPKLHKSLMELKADVMKIFANKDDVKNADMNQVDQFRNAILKWRDGPAGKQFKPVEESLMMQMNKTSGTPTRKASFGRPSALAESASDEVIESDVSEQQRLANTTSPGVMIEFEFSGTALAMRRAYTMGVVVSSPRKGAAAKGELWGLATKLIGLSVGIAITTVKDVSDLGGKSCSFGAGVDLLVTDVGVGVNFAMPERKIDGISFSIDAEAAISLSLLSMSGMCGIAQDLGTQRSGSTPRGSGSAPR